MLSWNKDGTYQLYLWNTADGTFDRITDDPAGHIFGAIKWDGTEAYVLRSHSGSEEGHLHAYDPIGKTWEDITPNLPLFTCFDVSVANGSGVMAFEASMPECNALVVIDRETSGSNPLLLLETDSQLSGVAISDDGKRVAVARSNPEATEESWDIILCDVDGKKEIGSYAFVGGHAIPAAIIGNRILASTNVRGFEEPVWIDVSLGSRTFLQEQSKHDIYALATDTDGKRILCCDAATGKHTLLVRDDKGEKTEVPGGGEGSFDTFFGAAHFTSSDTVLFRKQDSTHPSSVYEADLATTKVRMLIGAEAPVSEKFRDISIPTERGPVQAWVAVPRDAPLPCPFVIDLHGGPHAVSLDAFSPEAQAWLDHGVGYCSVNYHGSVSFGKEFEHSIRGKPGELEVKDCVATKKELVRLGFADERNIVLSGWSWGGYVTLLAMGKEPAHWAAGIAAVPVADWIGQYENESTYLQSFDRELFGGSPAEKPDAYANASPITYVAKLHSPVLIIAGKNDSRCPFVQIERYVNAAAEAGKDVSLHAFASGHTGAFTDPAVGIEAFEAARSFLTDKKILSRT